MRNYRVTFKCRMTTDVRTLYLSGPNEGEAIYALVRQGAVKPEHANQTIVLKFEAL